MYRILRLNDSISDATEYLKIRKAIDNFEIEEKLEELRDIWENEGIDEEFVDFVYNEAPDDWDVHYATEDDFIDFWI